MQISASGGSVFSANQQRYVCSPMVVEAASLSIQTIGILRMDPMRLGSVFRSNSMPKANRFSSRSVHISHTVSAVNVLNPYWVSMM